MRGLQAAAASSQTRQRACEEEEECMGGCILAPRVVPKIRARIELNFEFGSLATRHTALKLCGWGRF